MSAPCEEFLTFSEKGKEELICADDSSYRNSLSPKFPLFHRGAGSELNTPSMKMEEVEGPQGSRGVPGSYWESYFLVFILGNLERWLNFL